MKRIIKKQKYFKDPALVFCILVISALFIMPIITAGPSFAKGLDRATVSDLYSQAKQYFREANSKSAKSKQEAMSLYNKSAMRYERLIKEGGIRNGKIYYNLGNIYFRMNDIGRAILNYLRAEQYMPDNSNLRQNLKYAKEKRIDDIKEKQETKVLKTLFFWHYDLSVKTQIILFSVFFALIWVFAGFRIFFKRPFLGWGLLIAVVFSLLISGSLITEEITLRRNIPGVIISRKTIARKGNSVTYDPSFKEPLHAGTEFILLEKRNGWDHVELMDSRTCWLRSDDVELVR